MIRPMQVLTLLCFLFGATTIARAVPAAFHMTGLDTTAAWQVTSDLYPATLNSPSGGFCNWSIHRMDGNCLGMCVFKQVKNP